MRKLRREPRDLVAALALWICAVVLGAGTPQHAWAGGAPRGGTFTPHGTQPPLSFALIPPGDCAACHAFYELRPQTVEPYDSWAGSMMANAGRDPLFWAALDVANNDAPGAGAFCLRCHSPRGWLAGRVEGPGGSPDGCALDGQIDQPDNDFSGIDCHLCHRMMENPSPPEGEQSLYLENGQFWLDDAACAGSDEPCRRGPYDYPADGIAPPHAWEASPLHSSSDLCGTCHNVTSPTTTLIDAGVDTGIPYPIERTYDEWLASDYAQEGIGHLPCQGCHMPDPGLDGQWACSFNWGNETNDHTGNLPVHVFVGGNSWVPELLRGEYPMLFRDAEFQQTRDWALAMLTEQSALLEVTSDGDVVAGAPASLVTRVTNLSGHKLPTGYVEGRRMWIALDVVDAEGTPIFSSGAYDFETGDLTQDDQIKIYQSLRGVWNWNGDGECDHVDDGSGKEFFHFVLNDCIINDNRIPPSGFTGGTDPETRPYGYSYPETSEGSGVLVHYDDTTYTFDVPANAVLPLAVSATLYYQLASKEYVEFLRDEAVANSFPDDCIDRTDGAPGMSRGEILYDMWERYDRAAPVPMQVVATSIGDRIFDDDFETGGPERWSLSVP